MRVSPLVLLFFAACSSSSDPTLSVPPGGDGRPSGHSRASDPTTEVPGQGGAGGLTAGDFDDNLNFGLFTRYVADVRQRRPVSPALDPAGRVVITVDDGAGAPVPFAAVRVREAGATLFEGVTGADGRAHFFPAIDGAQGGPLSLEVSSGGVSAQLSPTSTIAWTASLPGAATALPTTLDLAFVVDTTGSMGDELGYITREIDGIVTAITAIFPRVTIRYALVVYRDVGDEYVARSVDFVGDLAAFKASLAAQSANGGGDYPEAMDRGLQDMNQLSWRAGATARVAFLVADAPPQPGDETLALAHALDSRARGIKLYPVAASGAADEAEFVMRWAAVLTGARYVFLTDDSGIGAPHAEPHFPCYQVLQFADVVKRAIASELKGVRVHAAEGQVIREVGAPVDGVCTLADGTRVRL